MQAKFEISFATRRPYDCCQAKIQFFLQSYAFKFAAKLKGEFCMHPDAFMSAAEHVCCKTKMHFLQSCALMFAPNLKGKML